jgi:hypothetical protein
MLAIALMLEAIRTSKTSLNFHQTKQRYNPEGSHLHARRREMTFQMLIYVL